MTAERTGAAGGRGMGFTQRLATACARRPWLTLGVWLVVLVVAGSLYLFWGDVFTSSSKFLNDPDSKKAMELVQQHGGGSSSSVAQASASVQRLADGITGARRGARGLAEGSGRLSAGTNRLASGLRSLAGGAGAVTGGSRQTSAGAASLSRGLADASQGAASLSSGISRASGGAGQFNAGLLGLSRGATRLSAATRSVAGGAADLAGGADSAAAGVKDASTAAKQLAAGTGNLQALVKAYLDAHPEAADDATYQQIVALAGQLAAGSSGLSTGLDSASAGTSSVASGARKLSSGASGLVSGANGLDAGLARSVSGAHRLDRSLGALAAGGTDLAAGVGSAAAGSRELAAGSSRLAAGSGKIAAGVSAAAGSAGRVARATSRVRAGATSLSKGLASASAGADQLSTSLSSIGTLTDHDSELVIVHSDGLTVDDPAFRQEVVRVRDQLAALPPADVVNVFSRYDRGLDAATRDALTSRNRHTTILKVELSTSTDEAMNHLKGVSRIVAQADASPRFAVAVTGPAALSSDAQLLARRDLHRAELISVPVALVILILVFGAVAAAGLPLVLSFVAIVVGLALTVLVGHTFELSVFALNVLSAMGLAVGIDYSLFIVSRYREERRTGLDKLAAIQAASATASKAVFFSGMTVVLALVGLLIVPLSIFTSLAVGGMCAVFAAVLAALTLLPALLSLLGDRIDALRLPWLDRYGDRKQQDGWWGRAARRIMRHPAVALCLGVLFLLAIAAPVLTMHTGGFSAASFPREYTSKQGLDMLKRDFPAGMSEPTTVVIDADLGDPRVRQALSRFVDVLQADGRFKVAGVSASLDRTLTVVTLVQDADAMSGPGVTAVKDLRHTLVPRAFAGTGAHVYVGGTTASQIDSVRLTDDYMPIVIAVVLSLSFVLLLLAFRSVAVSVTAILMNLLSVAASYGALTLAFQHGWGAPLGLTRVDTIESWVPLLMFCVLFGLSMDYQVFLLSRIRERWSETRDSRESVVWGVQRTAGIITGAALIMVAVFAGMGSGRLVVLQQLGFGLAVAILLDAFVVRIVIAPALIALIGDRYWWLPRWLQWLPRIDIEGPAPAEPAAPAAVAKAPAGAVATEAGA